MSEAPKPTTGMAIEAGRNVGPAPKNPEALANYNRVQELKKMVPPDAQDKGDAASIAMHAEANRRREQSFSSAQTDKLKQKFGNGEVSRDSTGKLKGGSDEAKRSYEDAEKRINAAQNYLTYSEIYLEAQRSGQPIDTVITKMRTDKKLPATFNRAQYDALRQNALNSLLQIDQLRNYDGIKGMTDDKKRDQLEILLASDEKLREKIVTRLQSIDTQADGLTSTKLEGQKGLEDQIKAKDRLIADRLQQLKDNLGLSDAQRDAIKTALEAGDDAATLQASLFEELAKAKGIPRPELAQNYFTELDNFNGRQAEINMLAAKPTPNAQDKMLLAQKQAEQASARLKLDGYISNFGVADDAAMAKYRGDYDAIKGQVYGKKAADGITTVGGTGKAFNELTGNQSEKKTASADLDALKATPGAGDETQRIAEEANLISELDTVFLESVADTLDERRNDLIAKQNQESDERITKNNDKVAGVLKDARNKNWVVDDPVSRKRDTQTNRKRIGEDMRTLAYHGEEGVKRLIARDLANGGMFEVTPEEHAEILTIGKILPASRTPEQVARMAFLSDKKSALLKGDFSQLNDADKKLLGNAVASEGPAYRERLMTDYMTARMNLDMFKGAQLNLRDHELILLQGHFGDALTKSLEKSKKGKEALDDLKKNKVAITFSVLLGLFALLAALDQTIKDKVHL